MEALTRGAAALFILTNPVAAVAALLAAAAVARPVVVARVRWWWLALGALVAWPLAVLAHGGRSYLRPYHELVNGVVDNMSGSTVAAVGALAADRWSTWLVDQLLIAACVALTFTAWRTYRLRKYAPTWAEQDEAADVLGA